MERAIQNHIKYFYIILILAVFSLLIDIIMVALRDSFDIAVFILILLAIVNLILLLNNINFNITQRYSESKTNAKILSFTLALFFILYALVVDNCDFYSLRNGVFNTLVAELVMNCEITNVERLEKMAELFIKEQNQ